MGVNSGEETPTREEIEALPVDPDWEEHMGYQMIVWDEYDTPNSRERIMYLPRDEEILREDSFVVADEDAVESLGNWF